jgi:hypothetical protein
MRCVFWNLLSTYVSPRYYTRKLGIWEFASPSCSMGRHHLSRTDGGARSLVGQLDYELGST